MQFHSTHWGDVAVTLCYSERPPYPAGVHAKAKDCRATTTANFQQWRLTATELRDALAKVSRIYASIHASIHACMHASIHPSIHPSVHPFTRPPIHPFIHPYPFIHSCMHACMHTFIHTFLHPSIDTPTHPFIHTYTQTYIHLGKEGGREGGGLEHPDRLCSRANCDCALGSASARRLPAHGARHWPLEALQGR